MALIASLGRPAQGTLKPCLTLTEQLHLYTTSLSETSVRRSAEMTAAPTAAVGLSDSLTPSPSCFPQPCLFNCEKPKVRTVYFKELCCFRNEKITLYKVTLLRFVLTGQIWQILTLVSCCLPQQAEGVIWPHAHPKAFVQLQKRIFFLLFCNFLPQKSSTWNIYSSLATTSSLPALVKRSFWSNSLAER